MAELLHVGKALTAAEQTTNGDHEDIEQAMLAERDIPRIGDGC
jgi:hypothetical protein